MTSLHKLLHTCISCKYTSYTRHNCITLFVIRESLNITTKVFQSITTCSQVPCNQWYIPYNGPDTYLRIRYIFLTFVNNKTHHIIILRLKTTWEKDIILKVFFCMLQKVHKKSITMFTWRRLFQMCVMRNGLDIYVFTTPNFIKRSSVVENFPKKLWHDKMTHCFIQYV